MTKRQNIAWVMEAVEEYGNVMLSCTIRRGSMEERQARAEVKRRIDVIVSEAQAVTKRKREPREVKPRTGAKIPYKGD